MPTHFVEQAVNLIRNKAPKFKPQIAITLGSGLGGIADSITNPVIIDYNELPGFPQIDIEGHAARLLLGTLKGVNVVCFQGRCHSYEHPDGTMLKNMIRTVKSLGVSEMLLTNAVGSLRMEMGPGALMLVNDHINFSFNNPLMGKNDHEYGERFVSLENAYDSNLRKIMLTTAQQNDIPLAEGVFCCTSGPSFETPAEIRALKILGVDAVGMSVVPEVIVARHCGLKVVTVSAVTNYAAGMSDTIVTHEQTLEQGKLAAATLQKLILAYLENRAKE